MMARMFGYGGEKLQAHIAFPDELDLSPALSDMALREVGTCVVVLDAVISVKPSRWMQLCQQRTTHS